MKRLFAVFACLLLLVSAAQAADVACKASYGSGQTVYKVATGSPGELGLLKELADVFNAEHDTTMCWVKAGSGKSLKLLHGGMVDACMVHAPAAEKLAMKDGWAAGRTLIGSNEFYIVGPKNDPAGIASASSAAEAYARIADARANFLSRGDNSGTHKKELAIWEKAGISPKGDWYVVTGDFMMATLKKADKSKGYFMTDSSTWVAGKAGMANLEVLYRGDPMLINVYHALARPEGAPNQALAMEFIRFLGSDRGQSIIRDYGKTEFGDAMYNDAEYARQYDH
ncbi:substrate-binding domain-containing protein [Pseudodesulfovibrio tunisiensis]|uniref:substrate-binding domain-containing protein n=1 Tax=Pseudodesulfovibrio tunisiensis TaxID=463192 RepID=UPI001FB26FA9|nr:substrate-binding domain-containing protein [Pseudodesulfovibrio tunisiensis]